MAALRNWNESYFHRVDTPVIAATRDQLRTIGCPTLVFEGNDDLHSPEAAVALHELVEGSELAPLPWTTGEWLDYFMGRVPGSVMALYPRLVSTALDFLARGRGGPDGQPPSTDRKNVARCAAPPGLRSGAAVPQSFGVK